MIIDLSDIRECFNDVHYPLLWCHDRYLILFGGAGSGKSWFAAEKILLRILLGRDKNVKHKFLCLRKTLRAVRDSVFSLFCSLIDQWDLHGICRINKTYMTIEFFGGYSSIVCTGLDDPEKKKSFEGITGVWLEEATEFSKMETNQIDLRLRGHTETYKQIMMTFNPIDFYHWIKQQYFTMVEPIKKHGTVSGRMRKSIEHKVSRTMVTINHSTFEDNKFIDDEYKAILANLQNIDGTFYNIYALGLWGTLKGVIFDNWEIGNSKYWPDFPFKTYGLDFGYENPSALIEVQEKENEVYLRQLIYQTHLTNNQLIDKMKFVIPEKDMTSEIVADCAEPDRIMEIQGAGFIGIIPSEKGKGSVLDGIDYMKRKKLIVHPDSQDLRNEFTTYKRREDKDGKILEEPVPFNDHGISASRYNLWTRRKEVLGSTNKNSVTVHVGKKGFARR